MKRCTDCGNKVEYNSYFQGYECSKCGSVQRVVRIVEEVEKIVEITKDIISNAHQISDNVLKELLQSSFDRMDNMYVTVINSTRINRDAYSVTIYYKEQFISYCVTKI